MTLNNSYINERCVELRSLSTSLQKAMSDGRMSELARAVSRINKVSDELINRIHDLQARQLEEEVKP